MTEFERNYYVACCDIAVRDIQAAASGAFGINPIERAVYVAQRAMREARRLGLIPSTAQIEAELRQAA